MPAQRGVADSAARAGRRVGSSRDCELIPPTVLLDPPDEAMVMREEIFGPLLPVCSYDSHDQALA